MPQPERLQVSSTALPFMLPGYSGVVTTCAERPASAACCFPIRYVVEWLLCRALLQQALMTT